MRRFRALALVPALGLLATSLQAALLTDDFNSAASAANYAVATSSADTAVTFGFDYSSVGIVAAPNTTDGTTRGVKFEANMLAPAAAAGITLHTNQAFSGAYSVKFDAWINANGPFPGGGGGSTEFLTAGVGGDGLTANLGTTSGSGGHVSVSGEGGSTRDYRMYKGSAEQFAASTQFRAGQNNSDAYYAAFGGVDVGALPVQGGDGMQTGVSNVGSFGFAWHEVELLVDPAGGGKMMWIIDGLEIGELDSSIGAAFNTNGRVTIGYADIFSSVSDAPQYSFGLVDNLSVTAVPEPSCLALMGTFGLAACGWRRRKQ